MTMREHYVRNCKPIYEVKLFHKDGVTKSIFVAHLDYARERVNHYLSTPHWVRATIRFFNGEKWNEVEYVC